MISRGQNQGNACINFLDMEIGGITMDNNNKVYVNEKTAEKKTLINSIFKIYSVILIILIIFIVPILPIMLMFGSSCKIMHEYSVMKKKCDVSVQGTIVDFIEFNPEYDERETAYRAVFSYEYNGKEYIYQQSDINMLDKTSIGKKYEILIYSDDPNIAYIPPVRGEIRFNTVIIIAGGIISLILGIGVVLLFIKIIRRKKCLKQERA